MISRFIPALLFLLTSGCVMADPEPQIQESHLSPVTVSEKQGDVSKPVQPVKVTQTWDDQATLRAGRVSHPENKTPSKDDIKLFQIRLKTMGFDPGPTDGVMGSKTEKALVRFQSTCGALDNVLNMAEMENLWNDTDTQTTKSNAATNQAFNNKNEIRLLQTQMKVAGLDPGPVDGIMGAKTKSVLVAAQTGCSMLKMFPMISDQDSPISEKPGPVLAGPKKAAQPAVSSTAPATVVSKKTNPQSVSRKAWLAPMTSN
jgi:hypothetical protein